MRGDAATVVRAWFDAFARSDLGLAREIFPDDAVLHATQPRELAGDYQGFDALLAWSARKAVHTGKGFAYELVELVASGDRAFALLRLSVDGPSGPVSWWQAAIYRVHEGRITEIRIIEERPPSGTDPE